MTNQQVRPMLAAQKYKGPGDLWSPAHIAVVEQHLKEDGYLIMQPKYDGFRTLFDFGVPRSRAWKPHANKYLQRFAKDYGLLMQGVDCEQLPGHLAREDIFRQAMSDLRSEDGTRQFTLYMYDYFEGLPARAEYTRRVTAIQEVLDDAVALDSFRDGVIYGPEDCPYEVKLVLTEMWEVRSVEEIFQKQAELISAGWEGGIVRRPNLPYKYNRSTALGGELVKVKADRQTAEAVIIGFEPWYENQNEATTSALGFTTRSSHQDNMVALDMLGAYRVRCMENPGIEFKIGVLRGVTHEDRKRLWAERTQYLGGIIEYSHDGYGGGYDKPRTPVGLRIRPREEF